MLKNPEDRKAVKVKLVKDATGGLKFVTDKGETIDNLFVKDWKRINGKVNRVILETIYLTKKDGKNW